MSYIPGEGNNKDSGYTGREVNADGTTLIEHTGASRKLGSSVLNELDSRTNAKFQQLRTQSTPLESGEGPTFSSYFNIQHNAQFEKMDSVNSHYSIHQFTKENLPTRAPKTPKTKNIKTEQLTSDSIKRLKSNPNVYGTPPPISEITRRIRRLRIRNSLTGTPESSRRNSSPKKTSDVKRTPITKQEPMKPPSFLQPTKNSLNKIKRSPQVSSGLNNRLNPTTNVPPLGKPAFASKLSKPPTTASSRLPGPSKSATLATSPDSVFDRLYKTSTMSRSNSMNNVNGNTKTKIHFSRSKTSSSLAKNGEQSNVPTKVRPVWR
ncbi:She1p KNAG_0H00930 [Huiozyma naganishii CBS 8797]|uniref:Uncharacterized protein n=1 Tax=Huiozyma naganishii (strain ATCC MYA-139 / BCRC 22969 / CBS 8797 / KCTC 17520 / NBRC 10181 / NCYC 3082 / Yp74L-3) TaxID=1071383 RepID=J7RPB1_HUIN7|nr:hypothetical protein KNAG_0H00930 [Kazachstania naganishii CBS 8797]CCK71508.1 hypothetical protein KNAG_0H00930 [Kazachstania naganishii CBS 8797]